MMIALPSDEAAGGGTRPFTASAQNGSVQNANRHPSLVEVETECAAIALL
jgi:hypothetical protein